VVEPLPDA